VIACRKRYNRINPETDTCLGHDWVHGKGRGFKKEITQEKAIILDEEVGFSYEYFFFQAASNETSTLLIKAKR